MTQLHQLGLITTLMTALISTAHTASSLHVHLPLETQQTICDEFVEWSRTFGRSFAFVSGMRGSLLFDSVNLMRSRPVWDSNVPLFVNPSWSYVTFSNHTYVDVPAWIPIVQVTIPIQEVKLVLTYTSFVDLSIVAEHLLPLWLIYTTVFVFLVRNSKFNVMFKVFLSSLSLLFCVCFAWVLGSFLVSRLVPRLVP